MISRRLPTNPDPTLSSTVFKKVDSISNDISSAQTYYEKKIVSIQEDLQGLGEWLDLKVFFRLQHHVSLQQSRPLLLYAAGQGLKHLHSSGSRTPPESTTTYLLAFWGGTTLQPRG